MYSRVTHYTFDTTKTDAMIAELNDLKQKIQAISGIKHCISSWREDGNGITLAVYEDQAAAEAAKESVSNIWSGLADYLTAAPTTELYDSADNLMG